MTTIDDFVRSLRARGCRDQTVSLRRYHAARARDELGEPTGWTRAKLEAYLDNPAWSASTRRSVHASLKAYARSVDEVQGAGAVDEIPAARVPRGVPRPVPDEVIRAALARADERTTLIVELMAYGGLRRGEVATVRGEHVNGSWLEVHGKGGHSRLVPLPPHLAARIQRHGNGWLFPGQKNGHLSARWVGRLVANVLPDGMTGHQLRHRYATTVYRSSHDIRAVQTLLGHARLDTTMVYTAVDNDSAAAAASGAWRLAS